LHFHSDPTRGAPRHNRDELANSLKKYPKSDLTIVGHTDATGSDSYNQELSERRSTSADAYLSGQGVSRSALHTRGLGESEPVASNESDEGRSRNRRVEVA